MVVDLVSNDDYSSKPTMTRVPTNSEVFRNGDASSRWQLANNAMEPIELFSSDEDEIGFSDMKLFHFPVASSRFR